MYWLHGTYFFSKDGKQNPYRTYAANPVAIRNSTYAAGRLMTMMAADLWLSATIESDTLAPIPRPIALPPTHISDRATPQNQPMPPTPNARQSTIERLIAADEPPPMLSLLLTNIMSTMLKSSAVNGAQTPKETPNPLIPPKPPYHIRRLRRLDSQGRTPIRFTKQASITAATAIRKQVSVEAIAQCGIDRVRQGQKRCGLTPAAAMCGHPS